jgi:hypothetical protein
MDAFDKMMDTEKSKEEVKANETVNALWKWEEKKVDMKVFAEHYKKHLKFDASITEEQEKNYILLWTKIFTEQFNLVERRKILSFFTLFGSEMSMHGRLAFDRILENLLLKKWYWEYAGRENTSAGLSWNMDKQNANYFVVRNGRDREDTFTLEIMLDSEKKLHKLSLKTYEDLLVRVEQLINIGFIPIERITSKFEVFRPVDPVAEAKKKAEEEEAEKNKKNKRRRRNY